MTLDTIPKNDLRAEDWDDEQITDHFSPSNFIGFSIENGRTWFAHIDTEAPVIKADTEIFEVLEDME